MTNEYRVPIRYDANGQYWTAEIPFARTEVTAATQKGLKVAVEEYVTQFLDDRDVEINYVSELRG